MRLFVAHSVRIDQPFSRSFITSIRRLDPNFTWLPSESSSLRQLLAAWDKAVRALRLPESIEVEKGLSSVDSTLAIIYHSPLHSPEVPSRDFSSLRVDDQRASTAMVSSAKQHSAQDPDKRLQATSFVIHQHTFEFDHVRCTEHAKKVVDYWQGLASPDGVKDSDAVRCHDCEYQNECEHRSACPTDFPIDWLIQQT